MPGDDEKIRQHDRRLGLIALRKGFIKARQLVDALEIQITENLERRSERLIGQILLEQGSMTAEQLDEVLTDITIELIHDALVDLDAKAVTALRTVDKTR